MSPLPNREPLGPLSMRHQLRASFTALSPVERIRLTAMYGSILGLHVLGFFVFIVFVVPSHYRGLGMASACWPTPSAYGTPLTPTTSRPSTTPPAS